MHFQLMSFTYYIQCSYNGLVGQFHHEFPIFISGKCTAGFHFENVSKIKYQIAVEEQNSKRLHSVNVETQLLAIFHCRKM